jgi:precorrin-6Y C5,15-methyltransferase (decarboxylating)
MAKLPSDERKILVIGVGDDGPAGLPASVLRQIEQAEVLVGGRRHLDLFAEVPAERIPIVGGLDDVFSKIEAASAARRVVVLASGDPCFYGIGPHLAQRLGRERVEIIPHQSSVSLAFARLGVSWHDSRVVSAHGRPLADAVQAARGAGKLAVLTDDSNTPGVVAEALLAAGADDAPAWVFAHLGGEAETETESTLSRLAGQTFASLNVLVAPALSWQPSGEVRGGFGLPESAYAHTAGLITKPEVRAVSLSKLQLQPGGVLWDIGAGSGSVAIEAVGLVPDLIVYAVERSEIQIRMLEQNTSDYRASNRLTIVPGEAPELLASLPDPDAIFVGGSGGRLVEILTTGRARVRPGGRIVVNLVTFEHVAAVLAWARDHEIEAELVQVSIARGATILDMTRLQAENPVTVVTLAP